jgi:hypothetical protein
MSYILDLLHYEFKNLYGENNQIVDLHAIFFSYWAKNYSIINVTAENIGLILFIFTKLSNK